MARLHFIILAIITLLIHTSTSQQCVPPTVNQIPQATWEDDQGQTRTEVRVEITNIGSNTLSSVVIELIGHNSLAEVWDMDHVGSGILIKLPYLCFLKYFILYYILIKFILYFVKCYFY